MVGLLEVGGYPLPPDFVVRRVQVLKQRGLRGKSVLYAYGIRAVASD
jgi:hypothetical protein